MVKTYRSADRGYAVFGYRLPLTSGLSAVESVASSERMDVERNAPTRLRFDAMPTRTTLFVSAADLPKHKRLKQRSLGQRVVHSGMLTALGEVTYGPKATRSLGEPAYTRYHDSGTLMARPPLIPRVIHNVG